MLNTINIISPHPPLRGTFSLREKELCFAWRYSSPLPILGEGLGVRGISADVGLQVI